MMKRVITLTGSGIRGSRVSALLLRDLLDVLLEGSKRVMRLQVEGRSTARGTQPTWLEQAATFDVVGIEAGSTALVVEAPSLYEALPDKFRQLALFGGVDSDRCALDYLSDSLRDAVEGKEDSELFDGPLIDTFNKLDRLVRRGVDAIELDGEHPLRLAREGIATIGRLKKCTPGSQRVRISGKLETIKHSDRRFVLLQDRASISGVAEEGVTADHLASLFGQIVIISGTAHFRPSGALLRVDAERIDRAQGDASVWATVPRPLLEGETASDVHRTQGPRSGVAAIIGKWPGDESDEDVEEALRQIS